MEPARGVSMDRREVERPAMNSPKRRLSTSLGLLLLLCACSTPLQKAARNGQDQSVSALLTGGADIEAASAQGMTPLMWAAYYGRESTVKLLLERGAKVDAQDQRARTALWYAATEGRLGIVRLLRQHGADLSILDILGMTASRAAQEKGETEVVQYLAASEDGVTRRDLQSAVAEAVAKAGFGQLSSKPAKNSDVDTPKYQLPVRPDDFAFIIGVERYKSIPDADYAARDADAVRRHAQALGFPRQNIIYLVGPNATRASLGSYLEEWLPKNVKENSNVLFYFSGHGSPDIDGGGSYLVPWDGNPSFLKTSAYSVKSLYAQLSKLKTRSTFVVLDTCFSGAGGRSVLPAGARPLLAKSDAERVTGNVTLLAAAGGSEITGSLEEQGHGVFTYYFLKGLGGDARNAGGDLTPDGLYWYLKPLVQEDARRQNRTQTPILEGGGQERIIFK
ncbi:MAG: ankyrin repeat domain-containing protein [Elusimicrobiota bacterium]